MRKALFAWVIAPLVLVMGMAGVAAYEAYTINVTARVSNALTVEPIVGEEAAFGIIDTVSVLPLSWLSRSFEIELSGSFQETGQDRVDTVEYRVCAQPKEGTRGTPGVNDDPFDPAPPPTNLLGWKFLWMGGSSFFELEDTPGFHWIGPTTLTNLNTELEKGIEPPPPPGDVVCPTGAVDSLTTLDLLPPDGVPDDPSDIVFLWWEAPVFEKIYNTADDTEPKPRDDAADCGARTDNQPCVLLKTPPADNEGTPLGLDLVIQVTNIN